MTMKRIVLFLISVAGIVLGFPHQSLFAENHVSDKVIVVLKEQLSPVQVLEHFEWLALKVGQDSFSTLQADDVYVIGKFIGYAGRFSPELLQHIQVSPDVAYIEEDKPTYLADIGVPPFELASESFLSRVLQEGEKELSFLSRVFEGEKQGQSFEVPFTEEQDTMWHQIERYLKQGDKVEKQDVQYNAPWNLARLGEQRASQGNNYFQYDNSGGADSIIFIVDTGVNIDHSDFQNTGYKRAFYGFNAIQGEDHKDYHSHGSHVAGIAAGGNWGVAKKAIVVSVKVMNRNGGGTESLLLSGLNWLGRVATQNRRPVINISIVQQGVSNAINSAVDNLSAKGFLIAVGAGNDGKDACGFSPASANSVLTVAAIDNGDNVPSWSNYGSCVDIFAPGASITSVSNSDNYGTNQKSGTSMASPHVAGSLALLYGNSQWSSSQIRGDLLNRGTNGVISNVPQNTPNKAIFVSGSR